MVFFTMGQPIVFLPVRPPIVQSVVAQHARWVLSGTPYLTGCLGVTALLGPWFPVSGNVLLASGLLGLLGGGIFYMKALSTNAGAELALTVLYYLVCVSPITVVIVGRPIMESLSLFCFFVGSFSLLLTFLRHRLESRLADMEAASVPRSRS